MSEDLSLPHLGTTQEMENIVECFRGAVRLCCLESSLPRPELSEQQLLVGAVILAIVTHPHGQFLEDLKTMWPGDGAMTIYENCTWESLDGSGD